ncbi:MAG: sensor histidine kinase [Candidatus Heimdallarchaeota archaeon]|nr:sensor histidine kinase [Candidatus Heimdallarchaeota archaeon]
MEIKRAIQFEKLGQFDNALNVVKNLPSKYDVDAVLLEIRIHYKKGEFAEALSKADSISQFKNLSLIHKINLKLILCRVQITMGKPQEVDILLDRLLRNVNELSEKTLPFYEGKYNELQGFFFEKKSEWKKAIDYYNKANEIIKQTGDKQDQASILFNLGSTLQKQGKIDEGLKLLKNSLRYREDLGNQFDILESLNIIGIVMAKKGKLDEAIDIFKKSLVKCDEVGDHYRKAKILINLGNINKMRGKFTEARSYNQEALENSEKIGDISTLVTATLNLGSLNLEQGNLDDAINTYTRIILSIENSGNKHQLGLILNNIGLAYEKKGEFNNALIYYKNSLNIREELANKDDIAKSLKNVGKINFLQGNLNQANEHLSMSYEIFAELDNKLFLSEVSLSLGLICNKQGNIKESEKFLLRSLDLRNKIGNDVEISESMFSLVTMYLENNENKKAEKHLNNLIKIAKKSQNKVVITRLKLAEAAVLQVSPKISKKVEAQGLFEQVISAELVDFELTVFAMLNLCEFLLLELKSTNDEGTLKELNYLVNKLHEIAIEQESYNLISEILIIQSKLAILQTDVKEARFLIDQAISIAEERNIDQITLKATMIKGQLESKMDRWSELAFQNIPISEKIDELELEEFIQNMYLKKETTDMFVHDIKNLLQINLNVANLLSINNSLPDNMKEYVHLLESSSREIQMLISSYMTSEKLENGTFNVHYELVDLKSFINERVSLFKLKIDTNSLQVIQRMPEERYSINGDRFLLGRIFDNLIHNAVKFTPNNGDIEIEIKQYPSEQIIKFSNDGPTIPEDQHVRIFKKYEQYKGEGRKVSSGFGLGLAFCKKAIEKMEGTITIESPIEGTQEGVAFIITLPRK